MADEEDLNLDEGGDAAAPAKKKGLGNLFSGLLKWIIIAVAAIIVIVVVVFVTVKIVSKNSAKSGAYNPNISEEYQGQREIYDWYKSIGVIQTTTCDENAATVRVNVYLGYKKDDKATSTEITSRSVELKDFLRQYFRSKTAAELKNANNEGKLKMEIRNGINDKVLSSSKIRDISFDQLDVIEQN
ncbi:MAG: flagellar basal body-associated FliL family protein [Treponema sp.]|nr:flagellar basal body-associated FliL family protein [Treponema sp.]